MLLGQVIQRAKAYDTFANPIVLHLSIPLYSRTATLQPIDPTSAHLSQTSANKGSAMIDEESRKTHFQNAHPALEPKSAPSPLPKQQPSLRIEISKVVQRMQRYSPRKTPKPQPEIPRAFLYARQTDQKPTSRSQNPLAHEAHKTPA